jgi:hypothetical protein
MEAEGFVKYGDLSPLGMGYKNRKPSFKNSGSVIRRAGKIQPRALRASA